MFGFVRPAACRSSAPRSVTDGCPYPPLPCRAKNRNKIQLSSHRKQEISGNGGNSFHRCKNSFHRPRGGPPPSRREVFGVENRRSVECRRARNARPYNVAENRNVEIRLKRWVTSLQRLDAFATVGCTAAHRRGAHCAPVYPRCYNNPSRALSKPFIQLRVQGRNPARFNGGYGVPRGFKGEKFEISP